MDSIFSIQTQREYDPKDAVRIVDWYQIQLYLHYGAVLLDIYSSNGKIVAVFDRKDTKELYKLWRERKL